ncbi:MAG TPA: hypothetical protein VLE23_09730 [Geminicoccaceae bacterium]|nr:hypothetical protein [Geminicoccaceae bacterium]
MPTRPDLPTTRTPPRPCPVRGGRGAWLCACLIGNLLVPGCAREPSESAAPEARRVLAESRETGAIRTVVVGNPFGMDPARQDALVSQAMAEGVAGLDVSFTTFPDQAGAPEPHLVVVLNPAGDLPPPAACRAPETVRTIPAGATLSVLAVFCQGDEVIDAVREQGQVAGPTDHDFQRLLWRTAGAVFPDDYWDNYGLGILPRGIDLGIGGSFGF